MSDEIQVRLRDLSRDAEKWQALSDGLAKATEEARALGLEGLDLSWFGVDRSYRSCHELAVKLLGEGSVTAQAIGRRLSLAKQRFEAADDAVLQSMTDEWDPKGGK